jgi:hypothetical protein
MQRVKSWTYERILIHANYARGDRGRNVVIWPDADAPGQKYAQGVIECLATAGARSVAVVSPPSGVKEGWDAADALDEGWTPDDAAKLIDNAALATTDSTNQKDGQQETTLESARASTYRMEGIEWLWPNRFALGKLGLIVGLPDEGKGQIESYIAAQVTPGGEWPCKEGHAPLGNVILLTAEDHPGDTVVPRLVAAGADLERIEIVKMVRADNRTCIQRRRDRRPISHDCHAGTLWG